MVDNSSVARVRWTRPGQLIGNRALNLFRRDLETPDSTIEVATVSTVSNPDPLTAALEVAKQRFAEANPISRAQHTRARATFPAGHTRQTLYYAPFPVTMIRGAGAWLTDLDGHRYLDLVGDYGAGLYGHTCEPIQRAVHEAVEHGLSLGAVNAKELELAELISRRIPSMEQMRFCNSGTEAGLYSVLIARYVTGRSALLAFKGGYNGGFMAYGDSDSPLNAPFEVVKCTYNDIPGTRSALREHASSLAAVVVEPMMAAGGAIPGTQQFLAMLREETRQLGVLLIFDEVMTSRLAPGGLQGHYNIRPDLTMLGKFWGGGFNFGAFGGSREIMRHLDVSTGGLLSHAGTFNNNVVSMSAGLVGVRDVFSPEECIRLNKLGDNLRQELNSLAQTAGIALQVTGHGSLMNLHWHDRPIRHTGDTEPASSAYRSLFQLEMMHAGYFVAQRGYMALSLPLAEHELTGFLQAAREYLARYRDVLPAREH